MLDEFKKFAMRGNVADLAIGVIIGAAFGAIVTSLVGDLIMPIIGAVTGGFDFSNYFIPLSKSVTAPALADAKKQGAVLAWGNFVTIVINFAIIAAALFAVVNMIQKVRLRDEQKAAPPATPHPKPLTAAPFVVIASRCNTEWCRLIYIATLLDVGCGGCC